MNDNRVKKGAFISHIASEIHFQANKYEIKRNEPLVQKHMVYFYL